MFVISSEEFRCSSALDHIFSPSCSPSTPASWPWWPCLRAGDTATHLSGVAAAVVSSNNPLAPISARHHHRGVSGVADTLELSAAAGGRSRRGAQTPPTTPKAESVAAADEEPRTAHVNDAHANAGFCDNSVSTSKYTAWSFVPHSLFEQCVAGEGREGARVSLGGPSFSAVAVRWADSTPTLRVRAGSDALQTCTFWASSFSCVGWLGGDGGDDNTYASCAS